MPSESTRSSKRSKRGTLFVSYGFSLIELLFAVGIMGILSLGMLTLQQNQIKANNYLEFQIQRTQLHQDIVARFLNKSENCACLFSGADAFPIDPASPGITLTGVSPTQIDVHQTSDCTSPISFVLVDNLGQFRNLKADSIKMTKVMKTSANSYTGELFVQLKSTKKVLGPPELPLHIPVSILTNPSGSDVLFNSCSATTTAASVDTTSVIKSVCSALGGSYNEGTGECVDLTAATKAVEPGAKCGLQEVSFSGQITSVPCKGMNVNVGCPSSYSLVNKVFTDGKVVQKYCMKD